MILISSRLNEQQKKAVLHTKSPILVVAGPGTGKTYVIVEKVKYLINKKLAKPDQILALTFTEKAAFEMEERVDKALPYGYFQMWISTFHSFADQILRDEITHIGLNPSFKLMSDAESTIFLRNNLFLFDLKYFRPLTSPNKFLEALLNHFSRLKDEDVNPEEYLKWAKKIQKSQKLSLEERKKYLELAKAYDFYQKLKVREGYFDFSDLIYYLLQLFRKRKSILGRYQKHFKYILVDEFQDTNIAQYELIKLLCPAMRSPNLTVVGDDSQAIYKFRGASVSNILNFMKDYPKGKLVTLKKNYRSIQPVLDASYDLIKYNDPDTLEAQLGISKQLLSQRKDSINNRAVEFYFAQNIQEEADYVSNEILKLIKAKKYSFSDFAILVRANNYAESFIRSLINSGIPYQFWGPAMLFRQPEVKDLISYLNVLVNLEDTMSLYRVLSMDVFNIDHKDLALLLYFARKTSLTLFNAIEIYLGLKQKKYYREDYLIYKKYTPRLNKSTEEKLLAVYEMIKKHLKRVRKDTAGQVLYYFMEDAKLLDKMVNYKSEKEEQIALNISKFFSRLKNYETEHEDASVFAVTDYIKMSMELGESPLVAQTDISLYDAVNILTVHATKGLEFPIVFLINLTEQRFPTMERREKIPIPDAMIKEILPKRDSHELEERRLFYVGLTRAKDKVYLTSSLFYAEGKRERKISRFVVETIGQKALTDSLEIDKDTKAQLSIFRFKQNEEKIIKKPRPESYYSFSQLQTFLLCPLQYKLKYILRIPEPQTGPISFGITIHSTLEEFYRRFLKNPKIGVSKILEIYKRQWIPIGYYSKSYHDKTKKDGEEMLRNYIKKLHNTNIKVLDLERNFRIKIKGVTITGKMDRVDKKEGNRIEIIDYKTGKKGSDNDLKKSLQLSIYLLAATSPHLYNKKPEDIDLTFYFLQHTEKFSIKLDANLPEIRDSVMKVIKKIQSTDFTKSSLKACNRCSYCQIYSDTYVSGAV